MEVRTKNVDVYIVGDKEFLNKEEALRYEQQLNEKLKCTYYPVSYQPDLTEGRGYYKKMIVGVKGDYSPSNAIFQYLVDQVGKPIEMVMGVSPIDNWKVHEGKRFDDINELNEFLDQQVRTGVGDYGKYEKPKLIYINGEGKQVGIG